jgi:hypothetical protein
MESIKEYIEKKINYVSRKRKTDYIECNNNDIKKNKYSENNIWNTKVNIKEIQKNEFEIKLEFN